MLNPKQQKDLKAIINFKHSKDGGTGDTQAIFSRKYDSDSDAEDDAIEKMRRDLYTIPDNLDVDKIKQSRMAYFADRTALHIKNGLTEV